ncbi:MAG: phosphoglycerate dehydrogenase [Candidatus Jordarchaeaceae archaeon]
MKPKIYITNYAFAVREAVKILETVGEVIPPESTQRVLSIPKDQFVAKLQNVDVALAGNKEPFTADVIKSLPKLKMISLASVGYDNVDVEAATERGIIVTNTPGILQDAVADMTMGLILAVIRQISRFDREVRNGMWINRITPDVWGKTLGIVGLGEIGSEVARRALGFKMNILYYDVQRKPGLEKELNIKYVSLEELLQESDIVSLHVPLNDKTRGMIGKRQIALMKNGAYLINTARGALVDENALYEALKNGKLAGAGLDVLEIEPPLKDNPLLKLENVVFTPHVASNTDKNVDKICIRAAENIARFLNGKTPLYVVNPSVLRSS